jgi:uncharacterized membrane protein YphA (DoxX/SURF4 family)
LNCEPLVSLLVRQWCLFCAIFTHHQPEHDMKDLSLLVYRILLVAIFPISVYYKIMFWPAIANVVAKARLPYPTILAEIGTCVELLLPF